MRARLRTAEGRVLRTSSPAVGLVFVLSCAAPGEHAHTTHREAPPAAQEQEPAAVAPDPGAAPSAVPHAGQQSSAKPPATKTDGQEPEVWPTSRPKPAVPPAPVDTQEPEVWPTSRPQTTPSPGKADGQEPEVWPTTKPKTAPTLALPASAPLAGSSAVPAAVESGFPIHGSLSSQYRGRWGGSEHDNDLYEFLSVDFGDPSLNQWTAHVSARVSIDLDGSLSSSTPSRFFSLADTYDGAVLPQVYEAHVDATDLGPLAELKLGRQTDYATPVFAWFDGAHALTQPVGSMLQFGAYAGVPVQLYESSRSGDFLAGAFAESKLWQDARGRIDWMHFEDDTATGSHNDNLWSLGLWQDFGKRVHLEGTYTRLDEHNRDYGVRATWNQPEEELLVQASFYQLLEGQKDLALPIDPFFTALGELFPYYDANMLVSKALGEKVNLQAGLEVRRVTDDADLGDFNHDFERYFLTAVMSHVLPAELVLSVTGEVWDGGGTGITSFGADLSRKFNNPWETAIGTYYSLYKTDLFSADERDHVRTYYLRLRYRQGKALSWNLRYEYENSDLGPFNSLILGLLWHF